jgi:hypothetical protein
VEDIVRKYAYASQTDLPQLQDSPDFQIFTREKELMKVIDDALPDLDTDTLLGIEEAKGSLAAMQCEAVANIP